MRALRLLGGYSRPLRARCGGRHESSGKAIGAGAGRAIADGLGDTCALTRAGGVECWGYNGHDELGDGQPADSSTPVPVSGLASGVTSIAEGLRNACAITRAGGVKCWGAIYFGALGDGTTTRHGTPIDVAGLSSGVTAISAGGDSACAVTGSGGAKCWGSNFLGQLGDGTSSDRPPPVDVAGLTSGVTAIASGLNIRTCAIAAGVRVMCWGRRRLTPAAVSGLGDDVKAINALCALTAGGRVKCWGPGGGRRFRARSGHCSDRVVRLAIATGAFHTCAVLRSGGIDCWGSNASGQLGKPTTVDHARPVAVAGFGTATITVVSRHVLVTRERVAAVAVRCGSAQRCRGTLTLTTARTKLGSRRFSTPAGGARSIRVVLTRSGFARLVRAKRLSARVTVTGAAAASRTVMLVAPS